MRTRILKLRPARNRISILILTFIAAVSFATFSHADTLLGVAADYNVFVFGDMNVASDTQGSIATGGKFTASNYSVGVYSSPAAYSLVSGGEVNFYHGTVLNGGVYSAGNVTLGNIGIYGDVVAGGNVSLNGGQTFNGGDVISGGNIAITGFTVSGDTISNAVIPSTPVNFSAAEIYLKGVSLNLSGHASTGATTYNYSQIILSGSEDINYFHIDSTAFNNATNIAFQTPAGSVSIVNVPGTSLDFGSGSITGAVAGNTLFNFFDATNLGIHNIAVQGSILAPYAALTFNSGLVIGTVIVDSAAGGGQYNQALFDHEIPGSQPVPEPGTLVLLGSGLIGLAAKRFRRKRGES